MGVKKFMDVHTTLMFVDVTPSNIDWYGSNFTTVTQLIVPAFPHHPPHFPLSLSFSHIHPSTDFGASRVSEYYEEVTSNTTIT
jgi:hypothetical protein